MKRYFLFLIGSLLTLNASSLVKAEFECQINKGFFLNLKSNKLSLSEDALIDNTGGYVDIFANKYYIKTKNKLYYLDGVVTKDHKNYINVFSSIIKNNNGKYIDIKTLYSLKDIDSFKFIQKIDLEKNNKQQRSKNITTTNILKIYFDKNSLEKAFQKCK